MLSRSGIDIHLEAGAHAIGEKAALLTEVFIRLARARLGPFGFEVATPNRPGSAARRSRCATPMGSPIVRAVADRGVIGDFRPPDLCRFGLAPLYTRFVDVWDAVERIADVVESGMQPAARSTSEDVRDPLTSACDCGRVYTANGLYTYGVDAVAFAVGEAVRGYRSDLEVPDAP